MTFKGPRQTMLRSFQRWMTLAHWPIFFSTGKETGRTVLWFIIRILSLPFFSRNESEYGARCTLHFAAQPIPFQVPRTFEPLSVRGCVKKLFLIFDTSLLYDRLILRPRYLVSGYTATSYPRYFPVPWARGKLGVICIAGDLTGIELPRQEKHGF